MSRSIAALALLTTCVVALADTPPDAVVDEIVELRQAFGAADAFATDERQFADAVRREASQAQPYGGFQPSERGWGDYPSHNAFVPGPTAPAFGSPENRLDSSTPTKRKHQLLRAAFALEKIAHELELADHGLEADTVRAAASKVRRTARRSGDQQKHSDKHRKQAMRERKAVDAELRRIEREMAQAEAARAQAEEARRIAQEARKEAERQRQRAEDARRRAEQARNDGNLLKEVHRGPRDGDADSATVEAPPQ